MQQFLPIIVRQVLTQGARIAARYLPGHQLLI